MSWIWGKKKKQEKTKMNFSAKTRRRDEVRRTIKVHLELDMQYGNNMNIVEVIRSSKVNFDLPPGVNIEDAHLAHIEVLGELE